MAQITHPVAWLPIFSSFALRQMSAITAIPASTTMSATATSASASSSAHILRLNHKQLIFSLHGRRKSISASSSSFFSTYRFNSSISRSSRRISYPSSIRIRPLSPVMEWQDVTYVSIFFYMQLLVYRWVLLFDFVIYLPNMCLLSPICILIVRIFDFWWIQS